MRVNCSQGDSVPVAEYIMTANRLPKQMSERTNDRIAVISFDTWGKISVKEKNRKEMEVS